MSLQLGTNYFYNYKKITLPHSSKLKSNTMLIYVFAFLGDPSTVIVYPDAYAEAFILITPCTRLPNILCSM